jgi:hypothetical protein
MRQRLMLSMTIHSSEDASQANNAPRSVLAKRFMQNKTPSGKGWRFRLR